MFYEKRTYTIGEVDSAEALAEKLTQHSWCLCNGFRFAGLLFLNDATCEDGAQEYAVLRPRDDGRYDAIESITFSWCSLEMALGHIRGLLTEPATVYGEPKQIHIDAQDHRCHFCA